MEHTLHCEKKRGRKCSLGHWSPKCSCMTKAHTKAHRSGRERHIGGSMKDIVQRNSYIQKRVAAPAAVPRSKRTLLSLSTIYKNLPPMLAKPIDYEDSEIVNARKLYGSQLKLLTPKLIRKYMKRGQGFYGLSGQSWGSVDTQQEKKDSIEFMKFNGLKKNSGDASITFNIGTFDAYLGGDYKGQEYYGTGSGHDPVFVFISAVHQ
jgi:hypothetical protein